MMLSVDVSGAVPAQTVAWGAVRQEHPVPVEVYVCVAVTPVLVFDVRLEATPPLDGKPPAPEVVPTVPPAADPPTLLSRIIAPPVDGLPPALLPGVGLATEPPHATTLPQMNATAHSAKLSLSALITRVPSPSISPPRSATESEKWGAMAVLLTGHCGSLDTVLDLVNGCDSRVPVQPMLITTPSGAPR
jgi:hypothetical protein